MADFGPMLSALGDSVDRIAEAAFAAHAAAYESLLSTTQERARQHARWQGIADEIEVWDEDDRLWIGVRGQDSVSEAFAAEYGTDEYPPAPVLRTLGVPIKKARAAMDARLAEHLGRMVQS